MYQSRKTAFHLLGFQTVDLGDEETLIGFYVRKLLEVKETLLKLSNYMVADAYFSKETFVTPLVAAGFHVIYSPMRCNRFFRNILVANEDENIIALDCPPPGGQASRVSETGVCNAT